MLALGGDMGVPAEDALHVSLLRVGQGAAGNLLGKPQPARIQAVQITGKGFPSAVDPLYLAVQELAEAADQVVARDEAVKLVTVHRQMAQSHEFPNVAPVDRHADQVGHDIGQAFVVVPFHPTCALDWKACECRKETSSVPW